LCSFDVGHADGDPNAYGHSLFSRGKFLMLDEGRGDEWSRSKCLWYLCQNKIAGGPVPPTSLANRASQPDSPVSSQRKLVIAGIVGNILEWYDFSVYGYFAVSIGHHFFPSGNTTTSLLAAFGVFAAGFFMRPVGAVLFGHIGDNWSRERALFLSVLAMAVPTFLIGVIPDYQQIGIAASVLLVLLRLAQGISVGGEYTTSIVFVVEKSVPQRRGLMGTWCLFGVCAGTLIGSAIGTLLTSVLPREAMRAWGWRLPFIFGLAIGLVGLEIRRQLERGGRSVEQQGIDIKGEPIGSFTEALKTQRLTILKITALKAVSAVGFYTLFVYISVYFTKIVQIPKSEALAINTIALAAMLVLIPCAGVLSDMFGRKPMLLAGTVGVLLFSLPLFRLLRSPHFGVILTGQLCFTVLLSLFYGAEPAVTAEAFPARVRCISAAISHNICFAFLGGTAPMVATYLIALTGNELSPSLYVMTAALVSTLAIVSLTETAHSALT
jgi:MHS family proline/betaine transporter-like MFS transporter